MNYQTFWRSVKILSVLALFLALTEVNVFWARAAVIAAFLFGAWEGINEALEREKSEKGGNGR